jgi:hybrid cluster-associated redox disulfide protein
MDWLDNDEGPIYQDDLIAEIVNLYPETVPYLASIGMHCIGCHSAQFETLQEACSVHGLKCWRVLDQLNAIVTGEDKPVQ